jgi:hypothetical protein
MDNWHSTFLGLKRLPASVALGKMPRVQWVAVNAGRKLVNYGG